MTKSISEVKSSCHKALQNIGNKIRFGANCLGRTVTQIEGTDKLFKFIIGIGDYTILYVKGSNSYGILKSQLKGFTEVVGALNIVSRIKEWTLPEERKRILQSTKKTASKILLTGANALETIKFFDTCKIINLGKFASTTAKLPFFGLVRLSPIGLIKDWLVVGSSIANLTEQPQLIRKGKLDRQKANYDQLKAKKWKAKLEAIQSLVHSSAAQPLKEKEIYLNSRKTIEASKHKTASATPNEINAAWDDIVNPAVKSFNLTIDKAEKRIQFWSACKTFHHATLTKARVAMLSDISKIAMIALGTLCTLMSLFAIVPFMVTFLVLGAVAGGIGYGKFLYDDWYKTREENVRHLAIAAGK